MQKPTLKNLTCVNYGKPSSTQSELLKEFGKPHIDSFNFAVSEGLQHAVKNLWPIEFETANKTRIKLQIIDANIHQPRVPHGTIGVRTREMYPIECRQRGITYNGMLVVKLAWYIDSKPQLPLEINLANVPIMLMSKLCNLKNLSPEELIRHGEQENEWGGYFIVKGKERLIRILLNTRRNYPVAMKRSSWKNRDVNFSNIGIYIRCVAEDQTTGNNVLHFLTDGTAKMMIAFRRNLFYVPVLLLMKCLVPYEDVFIFQYLISGCEDDRYLQNCVIEMMRSLKENSIFNQNDARNYIGKLFRVKFYQLPPWTTDDEVCQFILQTCVLIHLDNNEDKFRLLVIMLQKLLRAVRDNCLTENPDAIMLQELLLGGHLFLKILKEKLQMFLYSLKAVILKQDKIGSVLTERELTKFVRKAENIESTLETFFSTGNLISPSGLGLQQDKGLTIMAENISIMRYMSHFRGVHRGAIFEEMRTTEPRQLLPDAWGFICPVHTPDGTPCGLLNHLTRTCQVADAPDKNLMDKLPSVLTRLGMIPVTQTSLPFEANTISNVKRNYYIVMLDGRVVGHILEPMVRSSVDQLRYLKIIGEEVPKTLEIILLLHKDTGAIGQFPGLYLCSGNARMMRPVKNIYYDEEELIGTFEQTGLDVAITEDKIVPGVNTHVELQKSDFLSFAASLIPMPDYNQSPRNMYQCQMGKQTMGTPCHNWQLRSDTKLYRLQTPATPLFRPLYHDLLGIDNYPMGSNAVIAVISYTGYDMEDAMIINKSSLERGFAHGSIYKCDLIELKPGSYFELDTRRSEIADSLDNDGLPFVGSRIKPGDVYYSYYDTIMQTYTTAKYTGKEEVFVDTVRLCGDFPSSHNDAKTIPAAKASILFRIPRNPSVGDKFASRAGQKGIFSIGYRTEDLPFTESGLVPDIVFNPHGFPSRMTIAMMIECMAGKTASVHGLVHDASPFQFSEKDTAINYFGELLQAGGYNYYGNEVMYSGTTGKELPATVFVGIVHYQRLRHMVSDKWQVRNTGPVDIITRQPLKGRKRGGGGRVGEMERDALIAHGTPYLIQDRFVDCSDKSTTFFCRACKTIIGPTVIMEKSSDGYNVKRNATICRMCNSSDKIQEIGLPYIFRYLSAELASVNIGLKFDIKDECNAN